MRLLLCLAAAFGIYVRADATATPDAAAEGACESGDDALEGDESFVWPRRTWPLRTLSEADYASFVRDGYLVVRGVVPRDVRSAAAAAIREFVGANDSEPATWYVQNTCNRALALLDQQTTESRHFRRALEFALALLSSRGIPPAAYCALARRAEVPQHARHLL